MTIQELFRTLDKDKILKEFIKYWSDIYTNAQNELVRVFPVNLRSRLANSIDIIRNCECTPENKTYIVSLDRDTEEGYLYISAKEKGKENEIPISMMGTDWKTQLLFLINEKDIKKFNLSKEYFAAILLYELTFFGSTPEEINNRLKECGLA